MVTGYCFMTLDICVANSDSDLYHKSAARYYIKTAKTPGKKTEWFVSIKSLATGSSCNIIFC